MLDMQVLISLSPEKIIEFLFSTLKKASISAWPGFDLTNF
jgi:hypothetical protein